MLVVADSSPLVVLVKIELIDILPRLFGAVVIPPEVANEISTANFPDKIRELVSEKPQWLEIRAPKELEHIGKLHPGEIAAISLARELKADLLLIDETEGRRAAAVRQIPFTGTVGVLEWAARESLIDLADAFERIKVTDFWISPDLLDERLRLFQQRNSGTRGDTT